MISARMGARTVKRSASGAGNARRMWHDEGCNAYKLDNLWGMFTDGAAFTNLRPNTGHYGTTDAPEWR